VNKVVLDKFISDIYQCLKDSHEGRRAAVLPAEEGNCIQYGHQLTAGSFIWTPHSRTTPGPKELPRVYHEAQSCGGKPKITEYGYKVAYGSLATGSNKRSVSTTPISPSHLNSTNFLLLMWQPPNHTKVQGGAPSEIQGNDRAEGSAWS